MVVPVFACLQRCVHDYRKYLVVSWRGVYHRRLFNPVVEAFVHILIFMRSFQSSSQSRLLTLIPWNF